MITWRNGTVSGTRREWPGAIELDVSVEGAQVLALAYPALTGRPRPGDRVLLNTTALQLGLGTGGYALVVAVPDHLPPDPELAGHLVKARYTPLQATVAGADEQGSPHHDVLRDADDIGGMPVVVADLHSAVPAVLAGVLDSAERSVADSPASGETAPARPPRVVYVMQDGGALPAWFSRTCAALKDAGWLAATVTTGQSFGGDLETATVHTGLLAARHVLGADIAVVAQGPGNLGTGTRWGFSGVAAGEAVNAVAALGGRPVASLRISGADPRERHQGISHHSLTAYGRVALARADVVVPGLPGELGALGARVAADAARLGARHAVLTVSIDGLEAALRTCPVRLSTMSRGLDEDLAYFLAAAAAGRHAARLLRGEPVSAG
ncbi:MAG TPA: DUF3866 family protein [Streptosporangiaceae bacterium]|nr:DUF3866 family protein [Streptosporangiaceae bacterium]